MLALGCFHGCPVGGAHGLSWWRTIAGPSGLQQQLRLQADTLHEEIVRHEVQLRCGLAKQLLRQCGTTSDVPVAPPDASVIDDSKDDGGPPPVVPQSPPKARGLRPPNAVRTRANRLLARLGVAAADYGER